MGEPDRPDNGNPLAYMSQPYRYDPTVRKREDPDGRIKDANLIAAIEHSCGATAEQRGDRGCTWYAGCYYCWSSAGGYWYVVRCIWDTQTPSG